MLARGFRHSAYIIWRETSGNGVVIGMRATSIAVANPELRIPLMFWKRAPEVSEVAVGLVLANCVGRLIAVDERRLLGDVVLGFVASALLSRG